MRELAQSVPLLNNENLVPRAKMLYKTLSAGSGNIQGPGGKGRITGKVHTQSSQACFVPGRGDVGHMHLATGKFFQPFHGYLYRWVGGGADADGDQGFFQVQADAFPVQNRFLEVPDRFENIWSDQMDGAGNIGKMLDCIEHKAGSSVHQR